MITSHQTFLGMPCITGKGCKPMRRVIMFNLMTIDDFIEVTNHDISWHSMDAEFNDYG